MYYICENVELSKKDMSALGALRKRFVKLTVSDTGIGMDENT